MHVCICNNAPTTEPALEPPGARTPQPSGLAQVSRNTGVYKAEINHKLDVVVHHNYELINTPMAGHRAGEDSFLSTLTTVVELLDRYGNTDVVILGVETAFYLERVMTTYPGPTLFDKISAMDNPDFILAHLDTVVAVACDIAERADDILAAHAVKSWVQDARTCRAAWWRRCAWISVFVNA